jgi:hypothetical protein
MPRLAPGNVPAPWRAYLVGETEGGGSADLNGDVFTVKGSGRDIFDTIGFTLVAQPFAGDGEIVAQVTGISGDNINAGAKAGVMFLAEELLTDPGAAWGASFVTPQSGAAGQWRPEPFGTATSAGFGVEVVPGWVRVTKVGSELTFYYSPDGALWIRFGAATIGGFTSTVHVGLAVSSRDQAAGTQLVTATFANVKVTQYAPGMAPDAGAPPGPADGGGIPIADAGADVGTLPGAPVPAPWTVTDIGMPMPGAASFASGRFHLAGGGRDIWARSDNGVFVYQRITGDAEIRARLLGVQPTNQHAKIGLMFRASLDTDDVNTMWLVKPVDPATGPPIGVSFQWRATKGENSTARDQRFLFAPQTLRLARKGPNVEASLLLPNNSWFLVARQALALPEVIYVGLAVTSHDQARIAIGLAEDVTLMGRAAPPLPDGGPADATRDAAASD